MGGPFSFLIGLGSLLTSGAMALQVSEETEARKQEWREHRYSYYIQEDYDLAIGKMMEVYDFDKIKKAIKADYPNMGNAFIFKIAITAVAKRMMEEETDWEYRVPEQIQNANINIDKYSTDEFKKINETRR